MENLGGYSPTTNYGSINNKTGVRTKTEKYNNNNSNSALGNILRQIIAPDNNMGNYNNNNNNSNNTRTYTPPTNTSNSSSSSGSSSSSSGTISRPSRGGR
jgi:hypothetical protein